ncbi:MAG: hypothetical protein Ta2G_14950 [Termitinemataceae bacterium]|nr:MAG: hypothetical protein Ta2G_14950 [Termitinemataceae bacterium]
MAAFFFVNDDVIEAHVKVLPGSSKNALCGIENDHLKIKIAAAPEDGKANAALIAFLSKKFSCAKSEIKIKNGEKSRIKTLLFPLTCKEALKGTSKN